MRPRNTARPRRAVGVALAGAIIVLIFVNAPLILTLIASLGRRSYLQFPPSGWSTRWYSQLLSDSSWVSAIVNSFLVAIGTAIVCMILGTMAAAGLVRMGRRVSEGLLAVILTPMIIPHVVLAIGLYPMLGHLHLLNTRVGLILGHTAVAVPLTVIVVLAALQGVDPAVERAARSLGAPPWRVFREVTLPLIAPGVIGGGLLAFTLSFDELELTLFLGGPSAKTLPLKLWEQVQFELTPAVAAASAVIMVAVLVAVAVAAIARRRSAGRPTRRDSHPAVAGQEVSS